MDLVTSATLMVDSEDDDTKDGGARGEDHDGGVVDAEDGRVVCRGDPAGDRHQEHRHVQHGGDAEGDLLSGLAGHHEDKQGDDVDQEGGQHVVHHVESCASPHHDVVSFTRKFLTLLQNIF